MINHATIWGSIMIPIHPPINAASERYQATVLIRARCALWLDDSHTPEELRSAIKDVLDLADTVLEIEEESP